MRHAVIENPLEGCIQGMYSSSPFYYHLMLVADVVNLVVKHENDKLDL
jgi:hypothetical protein